MTHELYKTGDRDCPEAILDRNGEVVLAMCRKCQKVEVELDAECTEPEQSVPNNLSEDMQEGRSARYCGIVIVPLSSGKWYVQGNYNTGAITDSLDEQQVRALFSADMERHEQERARRRGSLEPGETSVASLSLEDMGL